MIFPKMITPIQAFACPPDASGWAYRGTRQQCIFPTLQKAAKKMPVSRQSSAYRQAHIYYNSFYGNYKGFFVILEYFLGIYRLSMLSS
jgi:hypothetical protein